MQLSETPFVFYIAIPAGTYEGGITLDVVDNDSGHMTVTVMDSDGTKTIAAGKVREFENVTYIPNKEVNLKQIYNDATFLEFVSAVAGGQKTLNARLTQGAATLSLSAATISAFNSIEDYKGTFDGNGKAISGLTKPLFATLKGVVKNLTLNSTISITADDDLSWGIFAKQIIPSSEVDDLPGLQNCTAQGSITWTPSAALGGNSQLGGLVGNNRGGAISGCTNAATVTFADNGVTNGNQPSIGGVVGRTQKGGEGISYQGDISNCTNSGSVICSADFAQNIYIGGVLGYQVEKAESISGCTNSGLVKVSEQASTGAALHLGGVIGMGKGTIESCSNLSGGVVTAEACSVATYVCQGGVVGRLNRESDTYTGLSNAGTINAAASDPSSGSYIGGVVGRCNEGAVITEFTNSGSINYTGSGDKQVFIGGIVATNTSNTLSSCSTTGGTISYTGETLAGNMYIGGIVGYATKEIANCSNAMNVDAGGAFEGTGGKYYSVGGIVGSMSEAAPITSCLNTGNITYSQEISNSAYSFLGGVAGRAMGDITDSSNGGTVTWSGMNSSQNPFIGGLVGDTANDAGVTISGKYGSASATNYGNVVINTSTQTNKYFYVGGVAGRARATVTATNAGQINIPQLKCTRMYLGGVVGTNSREMGSGNANLADGDITVSGLNVNSDYLYLGGITGLNSAAVTSATNAGDIITTDGSTCKKSLFVGGVVGRGEANISSCSNSGAVSNACPVTTAGSYLQLGGIVGYNNGSSSISNCHNTGDVSNSGTCNGYVYVGGITSEADSAVSDCDNTGDVTNSGNAGNSKWISVGGVVGFASAAVTSCSNGTPSAAGGTVSNSGTSNEDVNIGGVAGNNNSVTFTSCYNKGAVENSGNSKSGYNVNIGGLTGWSSAGSTYVTCYNMGTLTNTGVGSNSDAGVRMGGLIGTAGGENILTGTSLAYNYNKGVLIEESASENVAVGGICGYTLTAASNFNYCKSLAPDGDDVDDIEIKNSTKNKVYAGGIIGKSAVTSSMDYTYNSSDIKFTNLKIVETGQVFGGGIIGGWSASGEQTITGCENIGWVYTKASAGDLAVADSDYKPKYWSCFGGIAGMGAGTSENLSGGWDTITGKTFTNCTNSGTVRIYAALRCCIGGVVAYTENNPDGCVCTASDIRPYLTGGIGQVGSNYHRNICGGVVGLFTGSKVSNLKSTAKIVSQSSSPFAYTGGIIGYVPDGTIELENCKVSNHVQATGSGDGRSALMCHVAQNTVTVTFTNCVVKSGTISYSTGSKVTINDSNLTSQHCVGSGSKYTITGDVLPTVASSID